MTVQTSPLQEKLSTFLRWQRRLRRESLVAALACYVLAAALLLLLISSVLGVLVAPLWLLLGSVAVIAPVVVWKQRWSAQDVVRSIAELDKSLRLDERALTAWESLKQSAVPAPALLVIEQANQKLASVDSTVAFPRRWSWQAYAILPLLGLWLTLLWFDFGAPPSNQSARAPQTLAHRLGEFARQLQEKAQSEGLKQSLQAGKELEKLARQGLDHNTKDDELKKQIAGAAQKIAAAGKQATPPSSAAAAQSEQSLRDLRAELEAAREMFGGAESQRVPESTWLDRLAALPQLKRQLDEQTRGGRSTDPGAMKSFLEKMEQQVSAELDRRTLIDAEQFLQQMAKQGQKSSGETNARAPTREGDGNADDGEKGPSRGNRPGTEPGKTTDEQPFLPQFPAGPSTHVKGMLGEGTSEGAIFKGNPAPGKSTLSQEAVVASYRRQAEQDLSSERIPEALKDTIRNYFLSLGEGKN